MKIMLHAELILRFLTVVFWYVCQQDFTETTERISWKPLMTLLRKRRKPALNGDVELERQDVDQAWEAS